MTQAPHSRARLHKRRGGARVCSLDARSLGNDAELSSMLHVSLSETSRNELYFALTRSLTLSVALSSRAASPLSP
jgi:hypothetical protein